MTSSCACLGAGGANLSVARQPFISDDLPRRSRQRAIAAWLDEEQASAVREAGQGLLAEILPDLFGYHIVQLGGAERGDLLSSSRISHGFRINIGECAAAGAELFADAEALPLASCAVDVLVLAHVLEFADDPRRILREAERVLIGEGHLVVVGFNPWSWFGAGARLLGWRGRAPWNGHFVSVRRLNDWLQLLGFDIVRVRRVGFRPPVQHPALLRATEFLEPLGAHYFAVMGNLYLILGRKRVEGLTPLRVTWRQRRRSLSTGVIETAGRRGRVGSVRTDSGD